MRVLFPEDERDFSLAGQISILDLLERIVRFALSKGSRMDTDNSAVDGRVDDSWLTRSQSSRKWREPSSQKRTNEGVRILVDASQDVAYPKRLHVSFLANKSVPCN